MLDGSKSVIIISSLYSAAAMAVCKLGWVEGQETGNVILSNWLIIFKNVFKNEIMQGS